TLRREQILRHAITKHLGANTGLPVALACAEYTNPTPGGLHGQVWIPLGSISKYGRSTLAEIVSVRSVAPSEQADYWREVSGNDDMILADDIDHEGRQTA
ncbi:hypothetical protein, partial [Amycolatopsis rhizosphaerae]|uniref:hypothetical protein n=1 Tax=Amycolatopsis rhizosphaerae TaxID=2053003 RepID=UPI001643BA30